MRRVFLLAAVLTLLVPASADAAASKTTCVPKRAKTVLKSGGARIYQVGPAVDDGRVYACHNDFRRRIFLGEEYFASMHQAFVENLALAGRYVASTQLYVDDTASGSFSVRDLKTGNRVSQFLPYGGECEASIGRAVLARNGNSAVTRQLSCESEASLTQVVRLRRGQEPEVIARGQRIDPKSLRLARGQVSWTDRRVRVYAPLD